MGAAIRILLLADSHLGLDMPTRPRIARRRRGHDFLANHEAALAPALAGDVDVVVHGGDVFDRPRVPASLGWQALAPLVRVAERGIPVLIVPGNHERSRLPHAHLAAHPNVHVFDRPRTFVVEVGGARVAFAGFPFERGDVRGRFRALLEESGWTRERADFRLLCMHHCFEGATVGPGDFTFTTAPDVVRAADVPAGFAAVLSGHIHRHQVLTSDLRGAPLQAPVLYPGSVERTSLAEVGEEKGYLLVRLRVAASQVPALPSAGTRPGAAGTAVPRQLPTVGAGDEMRTPTVGGSRAAATGDLVARPTGVAIGSGVEVHWAFHSLPARPMLVEEIVAEGLSARALETAIRSMVSAAPPDAVLRIRLVGTVRASQLRLLRASHLRALAPETMNLEVRLENGRPLRPSKSRPEAVESRSDDRTRGGPGAQAGRAGRTRRRPGERDRGQGDQLELVSLSESR